MEVEDLAALEQTVLGLRGRTWQSLPTDVGLDIVELCFRYWRLRGFPYYRLTDTQIERGYRNVVFKPKKNILNGREIRMSMSGIEVANNFHPQMWSVPVRGAHPPLSRFQDDRILRKILRKSLNVWPSRLSVNESNLRRMLTTYSHTTRVSNFRPTVAKALYETWSGNGDRVLDFSAGYGGRLLGCCPLDRAYLGIDPCGEQVTGLNHMLATLRRLVEIRAKPEILQGCAEDVLPTLPDSSFSLVLSSPPYFDVERYSAEPTQSYLRYPHYEQWRARFLAKVIAESARLLEPGGYLLINVADVNKLPIARDTCTLAKSYLHLQEVLELRLGHKPYLRKITQCQYKVEPIFVFRKRRQTC